jgi:hypothetical protein
MGELLEWHRPALKAEWQRHGHSPEGMLALYGMAVSGESFQSPFLDHVVQDLLQIRLTLEQEQARGGKALDGDGGQGEGHTNKAAGADGGEIITAAVAVQNFYVSVSTLRKAVKDGRLHDYRPTAKHGTNSPLKLSRAEIARHFTQRKK